MPKRLVSVTGGKPLLDIASYARQGSGRRGRLSSAEIESISLTVRKAPEVMVKVLTRGGQDLQAVQRHLAYLSRRGELDIETDEGELIRGRCVEKDLLDDWDLDIDDDRRRAELGPRKDQRPPKLVHKILFSMPPGTSPGGLLEAVKNFAREEFALQHRYAMVLHTDEPHPHVHVVIKALSERGVRLNIRKETLRKWRRKFAEQLRREGVAANATERAVRGVARIQKTDGIYRASLRGESTHIRDREYAAALELRDGQLCSEHRKTILQATRKEVERGWEDLIETLVSESRVELALATTRFLRAMPAPLTEREQIIEGLVQSARMRRARDPPNR
jgi:hypothetical protein